MYEHNVCSVTSEPSQRRSRRQGLISATEQLRGELQKTGVLLIASTLLVVKAVFVHFDCVIYIYFLISLFIRIIKT